MLARLPRPFAIASALVLSSIVLVATIPTASVPGGLAWPLAPGVALAADIFSELRSFPGVVLLPPDDLPPFEDLEPWRVELNRPIPNRVSTSPLRGRYLVQYRDTVGTEGSAQIGGTIGREEFDQTLRTLSGRSFRRCPADADYCTENVGGQDGAALASEVFRGLTAETGPAVAEHVVCCAGASWTLTWYDAGRDMTYEMVLVGPTADRYGSEITAENIIAAETLAGYVSQLVVLQ